MAVFDASHYQNLKPKSNKFLERKAVFKWLSENQNQNMYYDQSHESKQGKEPIRIPSNYLSLVQSAENLSYKVWVEGLRLLQTLAV